MTPFSGRVEQIVDVYRQLTQAENINAYLNTLLVSAADFTRSEAASILEFDSEARLLRFLALAGLEQKALESLETVPVPLDGSLAGAAFTQGRVISISDARMALNHFKNADEISGFRTRSVLAVPIRFHGQVLGVFEVLNKPAGVDYNGDDVTILEMLAVQAAIAIQNVRLQRMLEKNQTDAERLTRMKNDFIAITSHELRTPLGLILGHSTFLREIAEEEYKEQLDIVIRNAMKLKDIIENMTAADNAQSGNAVVRRRTVSVRRLVEDILHEHSAEAHQKQVNLRPKLPSNDLLVEGDAEKIGIAISHLVKNAIAFTNSRGHIFIEAEQVPGYVKIAVIDNGIGIPAKDLPHIFERFFQVESHLTRKHGGMGLGLSVAKMMVEMHGGRIWAESVEGKGSNFTILLPLDSTQAEAAGKVFLA